MAGTSRPLKIELRPDYYYIAVAASFVPLLIAALFAAFGFGIHIGTFTVPYWLLIVLGMLPYYLRSCFFVQTDEFAGITVLETAALERGQGFTFAPLWLTELHRFPRAIQQEQFPGEPEQISHMPDEEADRTRSALLEPIRITTGGPEQGDEFKDDILNERLTFEPTATVQWQVQLDQDHGDDDQGFFEFYVNIPGKSWPEKYRNLLKLMRDTVENALNVIMSQHSAAWCIKNKQVLIDEVGVRLAEAVSRWGITICEVNILNITPSHAVNIALGRIPEAKANAQATGLTADAERNRLIKEGEGRAQARHLELAAEGTGLAEAAQALGMSGTDYRTTQVAEKLGDKTIILGTDGFKEAFRIGTALLGGRK